MRHETQQLTLQLVLIGEAPSFTSATSSTAQGTVLLTNDLTATVVDEALNEGAKVIICYRKSKPLELTKCSHVI